MAVRSKAQTVIANFSSSLVRHNLVWDRCFKTVIAAAVATVTLASCANLKTREEVQATTKRPGQVATSTETHSPREQAPPMAPTAPSAPAIPQPPETPPQAPTFLKSELPQVGVILGAGGMKSFAHLGVLREMARAKIAIHAIAGLEWGAVMGALYASQGQINEAEWKAFKLRESELPKESSGFLSSEIKPAALAALDPFLETAFGKSLIERSKIKFGCPSYAVKSDRTTWLARGSAKEALKKCVPYLPLYNETGGVYASPFAVEEAAAWLRSQGANMIILVNVMGQGEFLPMNAAGAQKTESLLWSEIRRAMYRVKSPEVHFTIHVNTSGHPITDFEGRRGLMDAGSKGAGETVSKIANQYGF